MGACLLTARCWCAGMRTVRYFKAKKFNWLGLSQQPTLSAKVRRAAGQLLPWSYEDFDWQLTSGACCACARHLLRMCSPLADRAPPLPAMRCAAAGDDGLRAERVLVEARALDTAAKRAEHLPPLHMGWCVRQKSCHAGRAPETKRTALTAQAWRCPP